MDWVTVPRHSSTLPIQRFPWRLNPFLKGPLNSLKWKGREAQTKETTAILLGANQVLCTSVSFAK